MILFNLIYCVQRHFQQYFSYIMANSFRGGRSRSTLREPPTMGKQLVNFITCGSPRFLCRPTALFCFARAVGRQRALHMENSGFASPALGRHISTFRGYQILFSIRYPYINRFTNHFSIHS